MTESTAIYPGFFDPITNGHLSILHRALEIFDKVIVTLLINPNKVALFSIDERIEMIMQSVNSGSNIEIDTFDGLLVDYAVKRKTNVVLRGLRALSDFEYEFQMSLMNRKMNRDIQTIFFMTDYKWFYTSSTIIKEAASFGGDVSGLVPTVVDNKLKEKFGHQKK